jgi:zinc protease
MAEATADLDASALADALFPLAAELSVQVDKDATVFLGRVHRDHERAFLKLFGDVLTRPRLANSDFDRLRDAHQAFLTSTLRTGNDEALQREALEVMLYGDARLPGRSLPSTPTHPYAHTPTGTVAGLAAITLDDVRRHKDAVFTVDRAVVGVGGGASDAFVAELEALVRSLPPTGVARVAVTSPPAPPSSEMLVIEKPSAGTAISVGFALAELSRSHPDYAAMKLAEAYFGEHRNLIGHLFHSMRDVRGLNYGDYAYVEHFVEEPDGTFELLNIPRRSQYFSMWIRPVEHKNRLFALRMTAWELQRFVTDGIPDDDAFERVRSFVMGYWASKEQEPMRRLGYAVDAAISDEPFDRAGLRQRVRSLTRADVNAAIARHLRADRLSWVVVTQEAAPFVDGIVAHSSAPMAYDGVMPASVVDEDTAIAAIEMGLDRAAITVVQPASIFER